MSEAFRNSQPSLQILKVEINSEFLTVHLSDERIISVPLKKFPKLNIAMNSTNVDLARQFVVSPSGYGIHWSALDEDISIKAFL